MSRYVHYNPEIIAHEVAREIPSEQLRLNALAEAEEAADAAEFAKWEKEQEVSDEEAEREHHARMDKEDFLNKFRD